MPTPAEFMSRVVPWPGAGELGFINLHWKLLDQKPPHGTFWAGRAFNSLTDFMSMVHWGLKNPQIVRDVYFCLSRQRQHGGFKNGKAKAARHTRDATALRAVWIDIDVKEAPKGYPTLKEAMRAALVFAQSAGLPEPTAFVASGGGLHVYWISDRVLDVDEWRTYAEGLKRKAQEHGLRADLQCTIDAARILRVPGTFNFKETAPREVLLLDLKPTDIDFVKALGHIAVTAPAITAAVTKPAQISFAGIVAPSWSLAAMVKDESLADGINAATILSWAEVENQCAFFRHAKATGGKDHSEPLWSLALLAATFFENGETLAHELGNQHPEYTVGSTDAKYEQKKKQKEQGNLGYPSCNAIASAGSTFCLTCPHFGKIKSPLNLGTVHPTPAPAYVNASTSAASTALMLPDNGRWFVDEEGVICELLEVKGKKGDLPETIPIRLFNCVISNPVAMAEPHFGLDFDATTDLKSSKRVSLRLEEMATHAELARTLLRQGAKFNTQAETRLKDFFMSWISQLNKHIAATRTRPFGWLFDEESGKRIGFAYGGVARYIDGRIEPSSVPDAATRKLYTPCGKRDAWLAALKLVTEQKRPHLEMIVASAFATPILWAIGETGGSLGFWSESAANKTTAVKLALSVWGHPKLTKLSPDTTLRSLEHKLGTINCLPAVIDDLQDPDHFAQATKMLFMATQESTRGRLKQSIEQREQYDWKTMVVATANKCFTDFMINTQKVGTNAALFRMLEINMPMIAEGTPGRVHKDEAGALLETLEQNYGRIGEEYAEWIVKNIDYVHEHTRKVDRDLTVKVGMKEGERFWLSGMTALIAGATFANQLLGCGFDVPAMEYELIEAYMKNRRKVAEAQIEGTSESAIEQIITDFLTRYHENQVWTDNVPSGNGGKPLGVRWLKVPERSGVPIFAQWCVEDRLLRIDKRVFVDFLNEKKYTVSSVMSGLEKHFNVQWKNKYRLAGGTKWVMAPRLVIQMPIPAYHFLETTLFENCDLENVPEHVRRPSHPEVTVTVTNGMPDIIKAGVEQAQADLATVKAAA